MEAAEPVESVDSVLVPPPSDHASAETVQRTLHDLFRPTTIVAVMHDLETARWYDRILVIGDGRIVDDIRVADHADAAVARVRTLLDKA